MLICQMRQGNLCHANVNLAKQRKTNRRKKQKDNKNKHYGSK